MSENITSRNRVLYRVDAAGTKAGLIYLGSIEAAAGPIPRYKNKDNNAKKEDDTAQ